MMVGCRKGKVKSFAYNGLKTTYGADGKTALIKPLWEMIGYTCE